MFSHIPGEYVLCRAHVTAKLLLKIIRCLVVLMALFYQFVLSGDRTLFLRGVFGSLGSVVMEAFLNRNCP
jgi:hypothetical protein